MLRFFGLFMIILDMPLCQAEAQEDFMRVCIAMRILALNL
jgi:hypothetical protein